MKFGTVIAIDPTNPPVMDTRGFLKLYRTFNLKPSIHDRIFHVRWEDGSVSESFERDLNLGGDT